MRTVELRMNELLKYETIKELVDHNGNKNRASKKLGISRRQVDRLIIKYKGKAKMASSTAIDRESQSMLWINQSPKILYYYITINIKIGILITLKNF